MFIYSYILYYSIEIVLYKYQKVYKGIILLFFMEMKKTIYLKKEDIKNLCLYGYIYQTQKNLYRVLNVKVLSYDFVFKEEILK